MSPPSGSLAEFGTVDVKNVKIDKWDENGLGLEPNNLAAIRSLIAYRAFRYGKHLDILITDQHSFCGEDPSDAEPVGKIFDPSFNGYFSEEAMIALDTGRSYDGGKPPAELSFRDVRIANPSKDKPPRTILGAEQKAWFKDELRRSKATWKIWGNSLGALDNRVDLQNLPAGMAKNPWPRGHLRHRQERRLGRGLRRTQRDLRPRARSEDHRLRDRRGRPPQLLGRICCRRASAAKIRAGWAELRRRVADKPWSDGGDGAQSEKDHPLRALFLADRPDGGKPEWTYNMLLRHGVRSCIEYAKSFDLKRALALSNPQLAPHSSSSTSAATATQRCASPAMRCEPSSSASRGPINRSPEPDGGPLRYRVAHTAKLWGPGDRPHLEQKVLEGNVGLSI